MLTENEAKKIVLKHLVKMYGKDTAIALFEKADSGDRLKKKMFESPIFDYHGLAYTLGRQSLHFFCELFLHDFLFDFSGDKVPLSQKHYEIWDELQDTMLNKNKTKSVFVMPRGYAKTSALCLPLAIWTALYCIHPFTVIQSSIQQRADNFISDIKDQIEDNTLLKMCFGEYLNKNLKYNVSEIELDIKPQRTKIQAVSTTTNIRGIHGSAGHRIGLLLCDDGQSDDDLNTEESRAALVSRFNTHAMKALESQYYHVVAFGTVQKIGDLYDSLLKSPTWRATIEKCVPIDDIDIYFRNHSHWMKVKEILDGKLENPNALDDAKDYYYEHKADMDFPVIWEKYDCYDLFEAWLEDNVAFKKEYQCDIHNLGEKRIHSLSAIPEKDIESLPYTSAILSIDPAGTNKKKSDYYAFCILSESDNVYTDKNGYRHSIKYARKSIIDKLEYDQYINMVIDLLVRYPDINALSIEKNVYMGADVTKIQEMIFNHPQLRNRPITIINKSRTQNKDSRIDAIIPDINMGRVIFNQNDIAAIEQIKEFAGCAYTPHDDMIDALADAISNIAKVETVPTINVLPLSVVGL